MRRILILSILMSAALHAQDQQLIYRLKQLDQELPSTSRVSLGDFLHDIFGLESSDPHYSQTAALREGRSLCVDEKKYLKARKEKTCQAIKEIVGDTINDQAAPTIGFAFSGGGFRAMIGTMGHLAAAQKTGILDATTYMAGLSGSTWAIASWMHHKLELEELKELMKQQLNHDIVTNIDINHLIELGVWKILYHQKLNIVGIWGSLIGQGLFSDLDKKLFNNRVSKRKMPKLSQQQKRVSDGKFPLPIYTSVMVDKGYDWMEFTPFEIGCRNAEVFIPSWSFGRKFDNGGSDEFAPEWGIDYYMGIWGSAFTASLKEVLTMYGHGIPKAVFKVVAEVPGVPELGFGEFRISPARAANFCQGTKHPWAQYGKYLTLVDAGLDINLPLPPLFDKERELDVIIVGDFSAGVDGAPEFKEATEYAQKHGIKLPEISFDGIDTRVISIFESDELGVPTIIYMPRIKNDGYSKTFDPTQNIKDGGYCKTFNLDYKPEEFDELYGLMHYNMESSADQIKAAIKRSYAKKSAGIR